jgi:hypothetical protein
MDHFREEIVVKKNRGLDEALYYLSVFVMVIMALIAVITFQSIFAGFNLFSIIVFVISGGTAVLLFLKRDRLRTEFEYTFTNGEMDFAKVFNNQRRKSLGTMRVKNVEAFGPVNSPAFQRYITMPGVKREHWFLNRGAELYYFYFVKDGNKRVIILEPSDEMVESIKKYLQRGAWQA